jgi:FlaA1/EpsC-like NDP-sugar epimerase
MILVIDLVIVFFSLILAYLLRFNFQIPESEMKPWPVIIPYILLIRWISFLIARLHAGIIRYTSTSDALRVFLTILAGSIVFSLTNLVTYYIINGTFIIPYSVIIIEFLSTSFGMILFRLIVKMAFLEFQHADREKVNVVIYGAGEAGIMAKRTLERDAGTKYKVLAFLDDSGYKVGKKLEGVDILPPERLEHLLENHSVAQVILAIMHFDPQKKQALVDQCLAFNTKVLTVPPMIRWINGELSFSQIKKINIEDLLEREEIHLDEQRISEEISGKVIMVTGAAGSIGSEIVRQVAKYRPGRLLLIDQAETPLHHLELEITESYPGLSCSFFPCDICNEQRMQQIFGTYRPDQVYHAAAYKHVPMMENHPGEAIRTNVMGTLVLANLAVGSEVSKFIMISTDKAVNPTNVMGASKRLAEMVTQTRDPQCKTRFITTRFGNVLGSNGSVIPLFRSQIEKGGPLTLTHPEVTRFFMTIPEACQLVLEAGAIGNGGEIFMFDMGKPVRILDLARKMIRLSGLTVEKDIAIRYIGLRPGEKLYEELLNNEEDSLPTHHPLILIAKVKPLDRERTASGIHELVELINRASDEEIVTEMKKLVPEFRSQNSVFEKLDA